MLCSTTNSQQVLTKYRGERSKAWLEWLTNQKMKRQCPPLALVLQDLSQNLTASLMRKSWRGKPINAPPRTRIEQWLLF